MTWFSATALAGIAMLLVACGPEAIVGCDPRGDLTPLCGLRNPEDLVVVPGGGWLVASEFRSPLAFVVMRVDPETLAGEGVLDHDPAVAGGAASVAVEHEGTLWIGTFAGDRLLRRPAPS
jgi:hypothetical protein